MRLALSDYVIESDSFNFTVYKKSTVTGENKRGRQAKAENIGAERLVPDGYYPDLLSACEGLLRKRLADSEAMTVEALIKVHAQTVTDIRDAIGNLGEGVLKRSRVADVVVVDDVEMDEEEERASIMAGEVEVDDGSYKGDDDADEE